jgi:hypothetical protein
MYQIVSVGGLSRQIARGTQVLKSAVRSITHGNGGQVANSRKSTVLVPTQSAVTRSQRIGTVIIAGGGGGGSGGNSCAHNDTPQAKQSKAGLIIKCYDFPSHPNRKRGDLEVKPCQENPGDRGDRRVPARRAI